MGQSRPRGSLKAWAITSLPKARGRWAVPAPAAHAAGRVRVASNARPKPVRRQRYPFESSRLSKDRAARRVVLCQAFKLLPAIGTGTNRHEPEGLPMVGLRVAPAYTACIRSRRWSPVQCVYRSPRSGEALRLCFPRPRRARRVPGAGRSQRVIAESMPTVPVRLLVREGSLSAGRH